MSKPSILTYKLNCPVCRGAVSVIETGATDRERGSLQLDKRDCDCALATVYDWGYGPRLVAQEEADEDERRVGIITDINIDADLDRISNSEIGFFLKDYIYESSHGGWEGFDSPDLIGVKKFLQDLILYRDMVVEDEGYGERQDADYIFRDEVCADMVREACSDTSGEAGTRADILNEAVRGAIDIPELRKNLGAVAADYDPNNQGA